MPQPSDATTKDLVELHPEDWLAYLGLPRAPVEVVDADVSTVSAAADKVLRVLEPDPWLAHVELQASRDRDLPDRKLLYNVLLERRHRLPVESLVVLLRPEADGPELTGFVERRRPSGRRYLTFEYQVVRAWQVPVASVLAGGLGTLPLAPLAELGSLALPAVIAQMKARLAAEAAPGEAGRLWTATYVLMGLRYSEAMIAPLLEGVREMEESVTYQAIVRRGREEGREEGRVQATRELLRRLGEKRFGPPPAAVQAALAAITDAAQLERLSERLLDVESWEELLAG